MKNILFIRSIPNHVDINAYNVQIIGMGKAFNRKGYNFDYIALDKQPAKPIVFAKNDNGSEAKCIEKHRLRLFRWGLNKELWNKDFLSQYDAVIVQEYYQLASYFVAKRHDNVYLYSGPYWNMFMIPTTSYIYDALFTRSLNKNVKKIFVKSDLAKSFLEKKGYDNITTIGVGLDVERFENVNISPDTEELVEYMRDNPCILYIGSLDANKNLPFLLDTFKKARAIYPSLKLVLIGKSKQSFKKKLMGKKDESYANEVFSEYEDILEHVKHINRVENPQLKFVFPEAKAFLLPSKREIFGMVLLEAMYLGAPTICNATGGAQMLVSDDSYGQIIEDFDTNKWVAAIKKYIDDPEYTKNVVSNAKTLISNEYTWDAIVDKILPMMEVGGYEA